jgi:hypothetical protein
MSVALYMDEHVPEAITDQLRKRGVDVITVQEDGLAGKSDSMVLDRAAKLRRIVVTYDDDFLREANRRQEENYDFYGIIHVTKPRDISIGKLIEELELVAKASDPPDFAARKVEYLPL